MGLLATEILDQLLDGGHVDEGTCSASIGDAVAHGCLRVPGGPRRKGDRLGAERGEGAALQPAVHAIRPAQRHNVAEPHRLPVDRTVGAQRAQDWVPLAERGMDPRGRVDSQEARLPQR